jgi:cytochrome c-type biogenesis protein CcmH
MTGWIIMTAMAATTFVALVYFGKLPRKTWEAVAAAGVLAMSGYALQGRPDAAGAPAAASPGKNQTAEALILMRSEMDLTFSSARPYLILSDAYARDGNYQFAASYIRSGIKKNPNEADLWAGLGLQLLLASDGQMSPPAKYAFDKARSLAPNRPAPDYFEGLTALFDGKIDVALNQWQRLIDHAGKDAKWKPRLESQVKGLQAMQASLANRPSQGNQNIEK